MHQAIAWLKAVCSALRTLLRWVYSLLDQVFGPRPSEDELWYDYDFKKLRFKGGRRTRFDQKH
jgi:hypothetical protein